MFLSNKKTRKRPFFHKLLRVFLLVSPSPAGIEPTAFRLGGERSILLSYGDISLLYSTISILKRQGFYFDIFRILRSKKRLERISHLETSSPNVFSFISNRFHKLQISLCPNDTLKSSSNLWFS